MRLDLVPHSSSLGGPARTVHVEVERQTGVLSITYEISGDMTRIRIPGAGRTGRAEGLWHHTCFELFVRPPAGNAYFEFNFSPGGEWAAYRFDDYRGGRTELPIPRPSISGYQDEDRLVRWVVLEGLPFHRRWSLGLSAIVEDFDGERSFWALAHPPGDPDFHHRDCFVAELPSAGPA